MGLQWGRNLSVAEGERAAVVRLNIGLSFNGAATFRLRKANGADALMASVPASMGPQPFGCGRVRELNAKPTKGAPLQWGRNLSVAEGIRSLPQTSLR